MHQTGIPEVAARERFDHFRKSFPTMMDFIDKSFLPKNMQTEFMDLLHQRAKQIQI